ncbi:MAG: reverse transcriptase family protein [Deltaproteobacteria bacterium]|nr:reverse transcriptase family protein [Deltaproteobacteria bacterium]
MATNLETMVSAAIPQVVEAPAPKPERTEEQRAARDKAHQLRVARWRAIESAGGIPAWIESELRAKLLGGDPSKDPSAMSDREKGSYKDAKKAEAAERRSLKRQAWEAYRATHVVHLGVGVHWQDGKSNDRFDIERREDRLKSNDLTDFKTPEELAKAMGIDVPMLRWFAFHRDVDQGTHYRRWSIPKRSGGSRTIAAPKRGLKAVQRWALRNVAEKLPVHGSAHGFLTARSIVTNAQVHAGAEVVIKMDVKDFFPTIHWRRVRGLFRKAGLNESTATLLSMVCTEAPREIVQFRGRTLYVATGPRALPQGAPTSPAITNALCLRLDRRVAGLARALGFAYTRYADDLTFSWRKSADRSKAPVGALCASVKKILLAEGFVLHPDKTMIMRDGDRQRVTGLIINKAEGVPAARVPRETVRKLRAAIKNRELGRPGLEGETLAQIEGMAAFIHMCDPRKGQGFLDRIAALKAATESA